MTKDELYFKWAKQYWTPEQAILLSLDIFPQDTDEDGIGLVPSESRARYQLRLDILHNNIDAGFVDTMVKNGRIAPAAFLDWAVKRNFEDLPIGLLQKVREAVELQTSVGYITTKSEMALELEELKAQLAQLPDDDEPFRGKERKSVLKLLWFFAYKLPILKNNAEIDRMLINGFHHEEREKLFPIKKIKNALGIIMDDTTLSNYLYEALQIVCDENQKKKQASAA